MNLIILVLCALILVPNISAENITIKNLRCEYLKNPLGVDVPTPRLSWIVESDQNGQKQTAYHILVSTSQQNLDNDIGDAWDSKKTDTGQSIQIYYNYIRELEILVRLLHKFHTLF